MAQDQEERIGEYRVHPVASMFPLMQGEAYREFRDGIEAFGQHDPIVVWVDVLLDGRNRLRACLDLDRRPRIEQYDGDTDDASIADFIESKNMDRRHLTEDQQTSITTQILIWRERQRNAAKQATGKSADGTAGGRGKKNPTTDSYEGLSKRDRRADNARSTVGQIAAAAKVSHHKASQAVAVAKAAPELLDQVRTGAVKLKDAYAAVRAAAPERPPKAPPKPRKFDLERVMRFCSKTIDKWISKCPAVKRGEFKALLVKECKQLCEK